MAESAQARPPGRPSVEGDVVLVVTGGLLTEKETSILQAWRKQSTQRRYLHGAWLDSKIKLVTAEPFLANLWQRRLRRCRAEGDAFPESIFSDSTNADTPELTQTVLVTLLQAEGIPYRVTTYGELFSHRALRQRLLREAGCVFASTTLLRDLSELVPLIQMLKRPHNRLVLGGALAGLIGEDWPGLPEVDVLAVGYGELLVPRLAAWVRSGYRRLEPPPGGRLVERGHTVILHSGSPADRDLDSLPTPDWALSARDRRRGYRMIYYESVRGCPYRCSFCNYPFLFDDTKFRYKSARRMADEWAAYVEQLGIEYITALDSLFTMPTKRLIEFCNLLIERNIRVKWICYARADDLQDMEVVRLMKQAGLHQVQIGIESGHPTLLRNMNKACGVQANAVALDNCRRLGLTTVVSLIVGFPGETEETLEATCRFLEKHPSDFHYLATFSTRATGVPVLSAANRERFGLETFDNAYCMAPYWQHETMSCAEVGNHIRAMNRRLMAGRVSLNAVLFYPGMLSYRPRDRAALLDYQQRVAEGHPWLTRGFDLLNAWVDRRLQRDLERCFPERCQQVD